MFLSKSAAISTVIPEGDQTEIDNEIDVDVDAQAPDSDLCSETREEDKARPVIAEEEAPVSTSDARQFYEYALEDDAPKSMDWREFCMEILDGQSDSV